MHMNYLSGNMLPLTPDSQFSIAWKVYSGLLWLIQVFEMIVLIFGIVSVPLEKALIDGTVTFVVHVEVFFMIGRIQTHRKLIRQLIRKLNDILRVEDETMRNIVAATVKPIQAPLKFYCIAGGISVFVWSCIPFMLVFEKTSFLYEDYRVPMVLSKQPFPVEIYLLGCVMALLGSMYIFIKKAGVDVYMIHLVLLLTAQHRYISTKLATIFRDANLESELYGSRQKHCSGVNQRVEKEIKTLCRHHNAVIQ